MTGKELEAIGNKLSEKTGLMVIFWYTEGRTGEEDKTYYVVIKDQIDRDEAITYFRYSSDDWKEVYDATKQTLKLFKYEID